MLPARRLGAPLAALVVAVTAVACAIAGPPSPSPRPTEEPVAVLPPPTGAEAVACIGINPAECALAAARALVHLPPDRGNPFSMRVWLFKCSDRSSPCPESLSARLGSVLVEYGDEGLPIALRLRGTPNEPALEIQPEVDFAWSAPIQPGSPRIEGDGPFTLEVGQCGLMQVVDFDGSFWVLVGQVDEDHDALRSQETGSIDLLGASHARYLGNRSVIFDLARFPGSKRFLPCN